jgi:putative DNA methylase
MNGGENDRRLIEDVLPVEALNAIAAKEKKHPKHPVALIHYWPARRPVTASRAAIYAALVGAPGSDAERLEAAGFVERLAAFSVDPNTLTIARDAIAAKHGGRAPKVLDLFAGGGAIPLEAARLGCDSYALEYNPVAHIIELCTLVYPQKYGIGLAADVDRWGKTIVKRLRAEVGDLYPTVKVPIGKQVAQQAEMFGVDASELRGTKEPMAYIWVRTVPCRKPGCGALVPLVRQSWLRKKGCSIAAVPKLKNKGHDLEWEIVARQGAKDGGTESDDQTGAGEAACLACTTPVSSAYVKECSVAGKLGEVLAAVVVGGARSKLYLPPTVTLPPPDEAALKSRIDKVLADARIDLPDEVLQGKLRDQLPSYGFERFRQLFTPRQLLVLAALLKHIRKARGEMISEGTDAERAKAVTTYLAMAFGRVLNSFTKFCRWQNRDQITIAAIGDRQALKMIYDFSEINPLAETAGCLPFAIENEVYCIKHLATTGRPCEVVRGNAEKLSWPDETFDAVVTDPPYYSSIFYADLSAFFYVWLRRIIGDSYPEHFTLLAPPKRREAVAQPSEHGGNAEKAEAHYRQLMERAFSEARRVLKPGAPLVCVYAHKTTEGWASLIKALVPAGLTVTEAWPVQTEARGRTNALEAAALSDSIFFVARRRETNTVGQYETDVRSELERIARERVATLWADGKGIGGADLLMAAVGAGLRPYTQHRRVEYANGEEVSAERYLQEIEGVVLDTMLEQVFGLSRAGVSTVDRLTRFYVLWRFTYRESSIEAGDAIVFCYPQGIELDGPEGISGGPSHLVEKVKSAYRVRTFLERGSEEGLGVAEDGVVAPLIDVLHRLLWLLENRPARIPRFLKEAQVNLEQLRAVAEALRGPVLKRVEASDALTPELSALSKLTSNWRSIIEAESASQNIEDQVTGQRRLSLGRTNTQ